MPGKPHHALARLRPCPPLAVLALAAALAAACDRRPVGPTDYSPLPLPDYAIAGVEHSADGPLDDLSTVTFRVRVRNLGGSQVLGTAVASYVDGVFTGEVRLAALRAGADTTVQVVWAASAGEHELTFGVDRPPTATSSLVEESNEANNTAMVTLVVPVRERGVVEQATVPFAGLPPSIVDHPLTREVLALARDSGHTPPPGALTLRTRYDGEGITSFITPLGDPGAQAATVPLLVTLTLPTGSSTPVTFSYVFDVIDSTTLVYYDAHGGLRVSHGGDSVQVLGDEASGHTGPRLPAAQAGCTEPSVWTCRAALRLGRFACPAIFVAATTGAGLPVAVAGCAVAALLLPSCLLSLWDNSPVITAYSVEKTCTRCALVGSQQPHTYLTWVASVTDDRGPTAPTFIGMSSYDPGCGGGTYVFRARDCGGNQASHTVTSPPAFDRKAGQPNMDCHDQGGTRLFPTAATLQRWVSVGRRLCPLLLFGGGQAVAPAQAAFAQP